MPTLQDLVTFLASPQNSRIWLLLDIKVRRIAPVYPWHLGAWS